LTAPRTEWTTSPRAMASSPDADRDRARQRCAVDLGLAGKVVIVTGAASGIGLTAVMFLTL